MPTVNPEEELAGGDESAREDGARAGGLNGGHAGGNGNGNGAPQSKDHKRTVAELAELRRLVAREAHEAERARGDHLGGSRGWTLAISSLLLVALLLRVYGLKHGLPFAYNVDEQ